MIDPNTFLIQEIRALAMILYNEPTRLIGRKSFKVNGSLTLGAKVINEEFQPFPSRMLA